MRAPHPAPLLTNTTRWIPLTLTLIALGGCGADGCSCGASSTSKEIPKTPEERLKSFASHLPQEVSTAVFLTDMDGVRSSLKVLADRFEGNLPVDAYRQEIKRVAGVDLLDASSYEPVGLHPQGGAAIATYKNAPVVLLYPSSSDALQQGLVKNLLKFYRVDALPKPQDGVTTLKNARVDLSFTTLDNGLFLVTGAALSGENAADSASLLKEVRDASSKLDADPAFASFSTKVATQWPASAFVRTPEMLKVYTSMAPSLKAYQREVLDAVAKQVTWTGLGGKAETTSALGRAYFGVNPETMTAIKGLEKPVKDPPGFAVLVRRDAYMFVRSSINAEIFWREYQKVLPPRQLRLIKRVFRNVKSSTGLDVEKDLIENATGNAGLSVYGIYPERFQARRAVERQKSVDAMFHFQVKNVESFTAVLDGIVKELNGAILKTPVPGKIVRYGFRPESSTAPPFAMYILGDLVTIASASFSEEKVRDVLLGDAVRLTRNLQGTTANALIKDPVASGAYLSIQRVKTHLSSVLSSGLVDAIIGPLDAVAFNATLDAEGLNLDGELTFVDANAKSEETPKPPPTEPAATSGTPPTSPDPEKAPKTP